MNEKEKEKEKEDKLLLLLEGMLHNRIKQKKKQIYNSQDNNNMMYIENLWTEIETIKWVLMHLLTILNKSRQER